MPATLTIGDFARATHLTVKALHHYHRVGLLVPADVDDASGYRRYTTAQIPTAQVIRRFRDLDMPLGEIIQVVHTQDLGLRNQLIAAHLDRLEQSLQSTQRAVDSLRDLLQTPVTAAVELRAVPVLDVAAITDTVLVDELGPWLRGALGELLATVGAQADARPGGVYDNGLFTGDRGVAMVFIPVGAEIAEIGRVRRSTLPAVEVAVAVHHGNHDNVDRTYGALAEYVAEHAISVDGPIRETYVIGPLDTPDQAAWMTEIAWPVFHPGPGGPRAVRESPIRGSAHE